MERSELAAVLGRIEPALSSKDLLQVLACFCFGKTEMHAYDDQVALIYPYIDGFKPPVRGAVRGRLLLSFLSASRSKEVEFETKEGQVTVKCGRAKLDMPLLPESDFMFEQPEMKKAAEITFSDKIITALSKCSVGMGSDPSHPWRLGVTMVQGESGDEFFSTNDRTITRVKLGKPDGKGVQYLLPPRFVELLLSLAKKDMPTQLYLAKAWVEARFNSGLRLFSKGVVGVDADKYREMCDGIDAREFKGTSLPKGLDRCFERALTVIPFAKEPFTTLTVKDNKLRFKTISPAGEVADSLALDSHPDVSARIPPDLCRIGLVNASSFSLFQDCLRFDGKGFTHLIATVQTSEKSEATT